MPHGPLRIVLDPARTRRWMSMLVERLRGRGHCVAIEQRSVLPPPPAMADVFEWCERALYGNEMGPWRLDRAFLPSSDVGPAEAELTIDLTGEPASRPDVLVVLYDGHGDDARLLECILDRRACRIEVADGLGTSWVEATPAAEDADVVSRAADQIAARLIGCVEQAIARKARGTLQRPISNRVAQRREGPSLPSRQFTFMAGVLAHKIAARLERLLKSPAKWQVGWRQVTDGGLWATRRWPVSGYRLLADDPGRYYADPFLFKHEGRLFLFVEEFPYATGTGVISVSELTADGPTKPVPIIETGSHLSYPFVFQRGGSIWMIPESGAAGGIHLYRAVDFPTRWVRETVLVPSIDAGDATIIEWQGRLWMFAAVRSGQESSWDSLWLFHSTHLEGPWAPHPDNPVLVDATSARPAGAMREVAGSIVRPVQYCVGGYGRGLGFARVTTLGTDGSYAQVTEETILPDRHDLLGFHTLNLCAGVEVVDVLARPGVWGEH